MYGALLPLKTIVHKIHHNDATCTRPWTCQASGLGTSCVVVCSIRPTNLAQASLDAHPKPKNRNEAIMTCAAKVRPCQSTLAKLGKAISQEGESLDAWYCLGKYRYWTNLLMWEPVPMPLLPPPTPN